VAAVGLVMALLALGVRQFYALISLGFCLFVGLTVILEFYKGAHSISLKNHMNLARAMVELTHRNTRRYGGYLVHLGIVLMFIGFTGAAFDHDNTAEVNVGSQMPVGKYQLRVADLQQGDNENYSWHRAVIQVSKNGEALGTLQPEKRFFKASRQPTAIVAVRQRLNEDLYLNFAGMTDDNSKAIIQAYVKPLVDWVWIGGLILIGGTLIALVPSKVKLQYARTEVVGITRKHVEVEK
jgi:cytochrome c-type biogenesis protein CcmF